MTKPNKFDSRLQTTRMVEPANISRSIAAAAGLVHGEVVKKEEAAAGLV